MSWAWAVVAMLWLVALLNYLDRLMITTMRDSLKEAIPMDDSQFGLLTSVFLVVYAGLSPLGGFLADRFSRSRMIVGSLLVWSLVTWLTGHARTFEQLLIARAVMGISEACYIPAALALIADYHRGATRSLATGIHMTGIFTGSALGGIGGWVAQHHSWSLAFNVFGAFGTAYAILLMFTLTDAPAEPKSAESPATQSRVGMAQAVTSLLGQRDYLVLLVYWGLLGVVGWAVVGWFPTYLKEHFQLEQDAAGFYATAPFQIASLFGVLFGGAWADYWSRSNQRGRIFVPMIGLCVSVPAVLVLSNADLLAVALVGVVVFGFVKAFTDANMMPILCLVADARYRATGYGVLNLCSCTTGAIAVYVGGRLLDRNISLGSLYLVCGGILAVCAILLFTVKPRPAA